MPVIILKYGKTVQITEIEKEPLKVRVFNTKERDGIFKARRPDNIRRTRQICMRRLSAAIEEMGSPLLLTLTFRGNAGDAAYANDSIRRFQMRLRSKYPECQSLFVPELSPHGRIHFHGLLFGLPMHWGDTRKGRRLVRVGDERKTRRLAALWAEGFVDATATDGSPRLATYLTKYLTKACQEPIFNAMRMLRMSRGFPREIRIDGVVAEWLNERFFKGVPQHEWSDDTFYLGKIRKRWFSVAVDNSA